MKRLLLLFGILACWTSNGQITAPFTESFDNSAIPTGWSNTSTNTSANAQWKFTGTPGNPNMASSASYVPAVILDHTGNSGGIAWSDGSNPAVADCGLLTDSIDVSALTTPYIEFWYYSNNVGLPADGNNTLLVNFYDGTQWNNSIWSYSGNGTAWQYAGIDLSAYTVSGKVLFEIVLDQTTSNSGFYNDVLIDDISVITAPPCPLPLGLAASNITATTADMTWNTSTSASSWDLIWGTSGFDPGTSGSSINVSSASHAITSLTGNTVYDTYLVADCGVTNGKSDTLGPISFRTACVAEAIGYNNGFENDVSNAAPLCWTNYISNTSATSTVVTFSSPYAGTQHLRLNSGFAASTDTTMIITPQLVGLGGGLNQIRFFTQTDDLVEELIIGTVSNPTIPTSFIALDTIRYSSTLSYEEIIIPLTTANGYNGTDEYVAFKHSMNATFNGLFIDDFNYEVVPPCPKITGISLNGATDSSATFGFNSSGSTVGFEWGPTGFAQGTGTTDSISANPLTIQGLAGNTPYDIYLRNDCSQAGDGTSVWTGPFTFMSACSPFTAPYTTNYDLTTAPVLDNCWTPIRMTNNANSEAGTDAFRNFSAPNSMELHSNSGTLGFLGIASPEFSDLDGNKRIQFMVYDEDGSFDGSDLIIGTMSDITDTSTFTPWDTIFEVDMDDDVWELFIVSFAGYTGTDKHIVFKHGLNSTFDNIHVDNFVYEVLPSCIGSLVTSLTADSITATSAYAFWDGGQGDITNIEWGIAGFTPATGANLGAGSVLGTDTTFGMTGLSANSTYEYYIIDSCNVGGLGQWIGPYSFKTDCALTPISLPYFDGFETYTGPISADGPFYCGTSFSWSVERPGNTGDILFNYTALSGAAPPFNGTQSAGFQSLNANAPIYLILTVDMTTYASNANGVDLSFNWADHADEPSAGDRVWARGNKNDTWIEIFDWSLNNSNVWEFANIQLRAALTAASQTFSSTTQIRWGQQDNAALTGADGFSIDDVRLDAVTCPDPTALTVTGVSDTSAYLNWTGNSNTSSYEVWMGPVGFYQGTQTAGGFRGSGTADSLLVDTMSPNTCYEYLVRGICGPGDTSAWAGPYVFCTFCTSQLSGTYTVNSSQPTGGTNFNSFTDLGDELSDCGVSGPVIINVASGTYTDHLHMIDVPGITSVNTITINGGGATLNYDGLGPQGAIIIDNASYITIDDFNIWNGNATEGWGIYVAGNSDYVSILNSKVAVDSSGVFRVDLCPIVVSGAAGYVNDQTYGADVDYFTVSGCTVIGGWSSIMAYGASVSQRSVNYTITNNTIRNFYVAGIYLSYIQDCIVSDNTVRSTASTIDEDGLFLLDCWDYVVENNDVRVRDWGVYIFDGNDAHTTTTNSRVVNNMIISVNDFALYFNDCEQTDVYHNTVLGNPALYLVTPNTLDFQNNIFASPNDFAFEALAALPADVSVNYNLYYSQGANSFDIGPTVYADLAAWQTGDASRNADAIEGDPVFLVNGSDLHALGNLADNSADNTIGVTTDFDGDIRSLTTPDIGADEFTALAGDLSFISGAFVREDACLTTNDTIELKIKNLIGTTVDFTVDPLTISYSVTGPITTSGTIVQNTGSLNALDTLTFDVYTIDMSLPGTYKLDAYISSNAINTLALNDTLGSVTEDVDSILTVSPQSAFIINSVDSVEITATSPFFPGGNFLITEICHFRGAATGTPAGGWPGYLTSDDYIEITGVPNSDLDGYTLEQWSTTGLNSSFTFTPGTVLNASGTCIIMTGQTGTADDPANFMYDGRGGSTTTYSSGAAAGRIIKDPNGNIVDAAAYSGTATYTFPAISGVLATDWSGNMPASGSTAGIRLEGPDLNNATGWISSATAAQDPNTANNLVPIPSGSAVTGFQWLFNGSQVSIDPQFYGGPYSASGTYEYVAELIRCGTTYYDTVTVTVVIPTCPTPASISSVPLSTTSNLVTFDTAGYSSSAIYVVEHGPKGFAIGSGTKISLTNVNSTTLTNLTQNLCQDVYMRVVCSLGDTSFAVGPVDLCPEEVSCDDMDVYAAGNDYTQSALFIPWQNGGVAAWGDAEFSTAQFKSAPNSLKVSDQGTAGVSDLVAYFDTINSGVWEVVFDMYVPTGSGAYFNIQQNHDLTNVANQWNAEVYFQPNGTAQIQHSAAATIVGTFSYSHAQWNEMKTIIDLNNDTIWFEWNGTPTGLGYPYSSANAGLPLQFNGINFFTGPLAPATYAVDFYVDDLCVSPYGAICPDPTNLTVNIIRCDSVELSWTSSASTLSSDIEWGTAGFVLGGGSPISSASNPQLITGLSPNTMYDFYVRDICTADTSAWVGPFNFNSGALGAPVAAMVSPVIGIANLNNQNVAFDANPSTGSGNTYLWRFGDGSTGNGLTANHDYLTNSSWTVTLIVSNACGIDSISQTVTTQGISLEENELTRSLQIYPNPTNDNLNIRFDAPSAQEATIRLLDLSGKEILKVEAGNLNSKYEGSMDISELAKGIYLLEIESGTLKANKKVVKQ